MFNTGLCQNIIKNCSLINDATVEYIINGADLMLKGVINRNDIKNNEISFKLNDLFYFQTVSAHICAIGISLTDKKLMNIVQPSGKFLRILLKIEDSLYNCGFKKEIKPLIEPKKSNKILNDEEIEKDDIKEDNIKEEKNINDKKGKTIKLKIRKMIMKIRMKKKIILII